MEIAGIVKVVPGGARGSHEPEFIAKRKGECVEDMELGSHPHYDFRPGRVRGVCIVMKDSGTYFRFCQTEFCLQGRDTAGNPIFRCFTGSSAGHWTTNLNNPPTRMDETLPEEPPCRTVFFEAAQRFAERVRQFFWNDGRGDRFELGADNDPQPR